MVYLSREHDDREVFPHGIFKALLTHPDAASVLPEEPGDDVPL
jgi:hypothetical protein